MSMNARFVQVTPDLLKQVLSHPSLATRLFETDEDARLAPIALTDAMRQDFQRRMPTLLAASLAGMNPPTRQHLEQLLGASAESLRSGAGGDTILKLMAQRGFVSTEPTRPSRSAPEGKGAVLSLEK